MLGAVLALIGHFKIKPVFLAMPEILYSDELGSKYRVTVMSYVKTVIMAFTLPMIIAGCVMLMHEDRAFHYSN